MGRKHKKQLEPIQTGKTTIGERIALLRKQQGYSQTELAEKLGITQYVMSDYETGRVHLNDDMIIRFSLILKVSADFLLGLGKRKEVLEHKPSLKIMRRLKRIEELPPQQQKTILQSIDMMLNKE